jgi:hypothetical protein
LAIQKEDDSMAASEAFVGDFQLAVDLRSGWPKGFR